MAAPARAAPACCRCDGLLVMVAPLIQASFIVRESARIECTKLRTLMCCCAGCAEAAKESLAAMNKYFYLKPYRSRTQSH